MNIEQILGDTEDGLRGMRQRAGADRAFTSRSAGELVAQTFPENDLILGDSLLAKSQSLTILGPGGIGKSRLLLQLAACSILGRPFLSLPTHGRNWRWLVIQMENSSRRLQRDLNALRAWLGEEDWAVVGGHLFIHTLDKADDSWAPLDEPGTRQRLGDLIEKHNPDIICFDPLNCFASGDLNNDAEMRANCAAITRLCQGSRADRASIVLHHSLTGKAGAARATGFDRSSFGRNSKYLQAWTRGQINIAPVDPHNNQRLVISSGKCSNGSEFATFGAMLDPRTMIYEVDASFDHAAWKRTLHENSGPARPDVASLVLELCREPARKTGVVKQLAQRGYSSGWVYDVIRQLVASGTLTEQKGILAPGREQEQELDGLGLGEMK